MHSRSVSSPKGYFFVPCVRATFHVLLALLGTSGVSAQWSGEDSLLVAAAAFSPPPDSLLMVDSVIIIGNEKTKDYVLLREMTLRQGDLMTASDVEYDRNRIYSLGLFTRVDIGYVVTRPPKASLIVVVAERWYVFPFPVFGIKDRDWKKFYFGAGVMHQNFRGRNEKLFAVLTLGYDPGVVLSYRNPLIDPDENLFLGASVAWRVVRNRSVLTLGGEENFDERHLNLSLDVGKRVGIAHTFWISGAYEVIRVSEYRPGRTLSGDGVDAFPIGGIGYTYDTRDLGEYAMYGSFMRATITKFGIPGGTVDFVRYALDVRRFVPLNPRISLAGRVFGDFSAAGQVPTYGRVYLGYSERIRGHFNDVVEGERQLGFSAELRFMMLEPRYFTVSEVPIPEFSVWRFGIAAAIFGDAGTVRFRGEPLALDRFIRGYGAGLHFLLPYGFVLRTEYALDELRNGEFIIDFSAAL